MGIKDDKDATTKTVYTLEANIHEIHDACVVDKDMRAMVMVKGLKVDLQDLFRKHGPDRMEAELTRLNIPFKRDDNVPVAKGETDEIKVFKTLSPQQQAHALQALRDAGVKI